VDIIVTLKQVPDPEAPKESFRIDEAAKRILNPANVDPVINGFDENAIEAALQIREAGGGKVTAICMGEEGATRALKQALAMGVDDAVLLHDAAFAGADPTATAYVLAAAIKKIGTYNLILCGRQGSDWTRHRYPRGLLNFDVPSVTAVKKSLRTMRYRVRRTPPEDGYEVLDVQTMCSDCE
jgi:electron transfer flavoprotein beta subunit